MAWSEHGRGWWLGQSMGGQVQAERWKENKGQGQREMGVKPGALSDLDLLNYCSSTPAPSSFQLTGGCACLFLTRLYCPPQAAVKALPHLY